MLYVPWNTIYVCVQCTHILAKSGKEKVPKHILRKVFIVTPAVYPHLVVNHDFSYFSGPNQLRISKPSYDHSQDSHEFANQRLESNRSRGF